VDGISSEGSLRSELSQQIKYSQMNAINDMNISPSFYIKDIPDFAN
jgi:hypothetical protein